MDKNKKTKIKFAKILGLALIMSFIMAVFFTLPIFASDEIIDLNSRISDRKKEIEDLQKQIDSYNSKIKSMQGEAKSLKNQIAILENQIEKINLDMQATEKKIEQANLEIQSLNVEIENIEKKISDNMEKLGTYVRLINKNDKVSYLEIILTNESFSDFFDQLKYTEKIHSDLKDSLEKFKIAKNELQAQKNSLEEKIKQEEELKNQLQLQKMDLDEKNSGKEILLVQTRLTERQYQNYLYQLQIEQQQINSEITSLEKTIRTKLEERETKDRFNEFGPARISWPVSPDRGITAYFHDPDYPFRHIFEHPAIDVRAAQGTTIKAAESGYVAKVKFNGDKSYAYIMLIHNDGLATVYGHTSAVYVSEDEFVNKGQAIGLSGGAPGTKGAGNLSTGPHLHFEVRLNGIPVNPLEYLPSI